MSEAPMMRARERGFLERIRLCSTRSYPRYPARVVSSLLPPTAILPPRHRDVCNALRLSGTRVRREKTPPLPFDARFVTRRRRGAAIRRARRLTFWRTRASCCAWG